MYRLAHQHIHTYTWRNTFALSHTHKSSNLWYKSHLSRQQNYWSLRCSWSIAYRHCSSYIFILESTAPGFNGLGKFKVIIIGQDKVRIIEVLGFDAPYIRDFTTYTYMIYHHKLKLTELPSRCAIQMKYRLVYYTIWKIPQPNTPFSSECDKPCLTKMCVGSLRRHTKPSAFFIGYTVTC